MHVPFASLMALSAVLAFAGVAFRVLTPGGGIAAFVVGSIVAACAPAFFPALVFMVVLGEAATRVRVAMDGRRLTPADGENPVTAQAAADAGRKPLHSPRGAGSVIGNGGVAALAAILYWLTATGADKGLGLAPQLLSPLAFAIAGALAAAACDTVSGEIGRALRAKAYLATSLIPGKWQREVPPGTNGGVSVAGTIAGILAAAAIALAYPVSCGAAGCFAPDLQGLWSAIPALCSPLAMLFVTLAGALGSLADSVAGATLEGKTIRLGPVSYRIRNNAVNMICTFTGAVVAGLSAAFLAALL